MLPCRRPVDAAAPGPGTADGPVEGSSHRHLGRSPARRRGDGRHQVRRQPVGGFHRGTWTNEDWNGRNDLTPEDRTDSINRIDEATLGGRVIQDHLWFFTAGRDFGIDRTRTTQIFNIAYPTAEDETRLERKYDGLHTAFNFRFLDSRHTLRTWMQYDVLNSERHRLNLSWLENLWSGSPYAAIDNINPQPFVTNPGYETPVEGVNWRKGENFGQPEFLQRVRNPSITAGIRFNP